MPRAFIAKLRPAGPWRVGPSSGDRLRVDRILHSDALYSAITLALIELGQGDEWLAATATCAGGSRVRLSSCFPFVEDVLFLTPPETHWPPPASLRIRWEGAQYVPAAAAAQLLNDKPLVEDHYVVDGVSECLLPVARNVPMQTPFRVAIRSRAAVDRFGEGVEPHRTACVEFTKGAGIWMAFAFADADSSRRWIPALQGALRLIADSGLGGERSNGWGRFEQPEFVEGDLGQILFAGRYRAPHEVEGQWLLSLFSPAEDEKVNWQQGSYRLITRTGRVAGSGDGKRANNMIAEGSVLVSDEPLRGMARDVAPPGFAHPVYRAGFALALPIGKAKPPQPQSKRVPESVAVPVEEPPVDREPVETAVTEAVAEETLLFEAAPVEDEVVFVEEAQPTAKVEVTPSVVIAPVEEAIVVSPPPVEDSREAIEPDLPAYRPIEVVRAPFELKPIEVVRAHVELKPIEIQRAAPSAEGGGNHDPDEKKEGEGEGQR